MIKHLLTMVVKGCVCVHECDKDSIYLFSSGDGGSVNASVRVIRIVSACCTGAMGEVSMCS